jgi:hypothetical protein
MVWLGISYMTNKLPFNATPSFYLDGTMMDDAGRRVVVNSVGGPSWPDNKWKRALENIEGTIVWGPCKLWFMAQSQVETTRPKPGYKPLLRPKKFITDSYWCVFLDGYELQIHCIEQELTFS